MMCKIAVALLLILNFQGFHAKSLPATSITACTLEEALMINKKHTDEILAHIDNSIQTVDETISNANENLTILVDESRKHNQEIIDDLQSNLNEAQTISIENGLSTETCLAIAQLRVDALSQQNEIKLGKCSLHAQEKQLGLKSKQASFQEKINGMRIKACLSLGKYALQKYSVVECTALDAHLELDKVSFTTKIDSLATKVGINANDVSNDYNKCTYHINLATASSIAFIKQQIFTCMLSAQKPTPEASEEAKNSEESVETKESAESIETGNSVEGEQSVEAEKSKEESQTSEDTEQNVSDGSHVTEQQQSSEEPQLPSETESNNQGVTNEQQTSESSLATEQQNQPNGETEDNQTNAEPELEGTVEGNEENIETPEEPQVPEEESQDVVQDNQTNTELEETVQDKEENIETPEEPQTPEENNAQETEQDTQQE